MNMRFSDHSLRTAGDPASRFWVLLPSEEAEEAGRVFDEAARLLEHGDFCILSVPIRDWQQELTPWKADPVFGRQPFGDGAEETLTRITEELIPEIVRLRGERPRLYLAGYSLAGLFSLWAGIRTGAFDGIAAVSPSVWYPGWIEYARTHPFPEIPVYLSLGDREERTRNPVMAAVGSCIREQEEILRLAGSPCILEWNPGNHFAEPDRRVARGIRWLYQVSGSER